MVPMIGYRLKQVDQKILYHLPLDKEGKPITELKQHYVYFLDKYGKNTNKKDSETGLRNPKPIKIIETWILYDGKKNPIMQVKEDEVEWYLKNDYIEKYEYEEKKNN